MRDPIYRPLPHITWEDEATFVLVGLIESDHRYRQLEEELTAVLQRSVADKRLLEAVNVPATYRGHALYLHRCPRPFPDMKELWCAFAVDWDADPYGPLIRVWALHYFN